VAAVRGAPVAALGAAGGQAAIAGRTAIVLRAGEALSDVQAETAGDGRGQDDGEDDGDDEPVSTRAGRARGAGTHLSLSFLMFSCRRGRPAVQRPRAI